MTLTTERSQRVWNLSTNMWDSLQRLEDAGGKADRATFPHLGTLRALIYRRLVVPSPAVNGQYMITGDGKEALRYVRRRRGTVKDDEIAEAIDSLSPNMIDELLSLDRKELGPVSHLATVKALRARSLVLRLSGGSDYSRKAWTPTLYGKRVIEAIEAIRG